MIQGPYSAKELHGVADGMGDITVTVGDGLQYSLRDIVRSFARKLEEGGTAEEVTSLQSQLAERDERLADVVRECEKSVMKESAFTTPNVSAKFFAMRHNADLADISRVARGEVAK